MSAVCRLLHVYGSGGDDTVIRHIILRHQHCTNCSRQNVAGDRGGS